MFSDFERGIKQTIPNKIIDLPPLVKTIRENTYIIFSEKLNRFYVNVTQREVELRLAKHNNHSYWKKSAYCYYIGLAPVFNNRN